MSGDAYSFGTRKKSHFFHSAYTIKSMRLIRSFNLTSMAHVSDGIIEGQMPGMRAAKAERKKTSPL
uniref:Uncharacterized protein n=1 Tax=Utricularia reniformis TaxID=192314 RepID=A0A1Y0AYX4_9LAMI|nr:hypothetical protein AEK19_MT1152 [Utricularia reniformis]ART30354.1 hypothetical protein AEK19_MT1152 [Utricularia reniformis]